MEIPSNNFHNTSLQIAQDFLQSVVVVDDKAFIALDEAPKVLISPGRGIKKIQAEKESNEAEESTEAQSSTVASLDAKELINSFAEKGLVCAVIKPEETGNNEALNKKTVKAAHRADIIILDWQIGDEKNKGDKAVELIKEIIQSDDENNRIASNRLRLIAIYTSNQDVEAIDQKIKTALRLESPFDGSFEIRSKELKIVLYQKSGGTVSKDKSRMVDEAELTSKLVSDFSEMTEGLLSNVALKSLGALRENSHRILSKFHRELDASYLSHRILTNPPEEAEGHPVSLLTSEFNDVLDDCNITECITPKSVENWIAGLIEKGILTDDKVKGMNAKEIQSAIIDLLKNGLDHEIVANNKPETWIQLLQDLNGPDKEKLSHFTKLLIANVGDAKNRDSNFAMLTTLRSGYNSPDPILKLGSIVKLGRKFMVCIQPLCDSVRLKKERSFPFLSLEKNSKDFDIIVSDGVNNVYLKINYAPYDLFQVVFKPLTGEKEIRGKKARPSAPFRFTSKEIASGSNVAYDWIADLKYPHAQRIINEFSYKFSRVGLMESDWLRRMARPTSKASVEQTPVAELVDKAEKAEPEKKTGKPE